MDQLLTQIEKLEDEKLKKQYELQKIERDIQLTMTALQRVCPHYKIDVTHYYDGHKYGSYKQCHRCKIMI
ncbi:MAG TPA: hypothetical protein VLG50_05510 [Candidatus Saccharimonadales bacterium]|nr:hypothetical protein [Candidatus Saccharimonadales bacterium]